MLPVNTRGLFSLNIMSGGNKICKKKLSQIFEFCFKRRLQLCNHTCFQALPAALTKESKYNKWIIFQVRSSVHCIAFSILLQFSESHWRWSTHIYALFPLSILTSVFLWRKAHCINEFTVFSQNRVRSVLFIRALKATISFIRFT